MTMILRMFGKALIETRDLDPVYCVIHDARLPLDQLRRFLLAYWCFYHMGAAAHMSEFEDKKFWFVMLRAAHNTVPSPLGGRWPRASERRYFRGPKCVAAVEYFAKRDPEHWVQSLENMTTENQIIEHVKEEWPLFGPWIGFKIADMMERMSLAEVKFSKNIGLMYSEPAAGLHLAVTCNPTISGLRQRTTETAYEYLLDHFGKLRAPPGLDRPCGPQEVETVLCKWKSHVASRYWVGKDIAEIRHALAGGWGKTADRMLRIAPREVTRG